MFIRKETFAKLLCVTALACSPAWGQLQIKITADNWYGVYTGTPAAALAQHGVGQYPVINTHTLAPNPMIYVVAWDDKVMYNGFLAEVTNGASVWTTGSPLWQVCATGVPLSPGVANAPTPAALTAQINQCNTGNKWHNTSNGPDNFASPSVPLWPKLNGMRDSATWIWDTKPGIAACAGNNGFLKGDCDPGEYLIFRSRVIECPSPVPNFTVDFTTGGFGSLNVNGTPSSNEANHFWSIQESDANWNRFGIEANQWFTGAAGPFDIKTWAAQKGLALQCNKYYRIKLAVQNQCLSWVETTQLVKLGCCSEVVRGPAPATAAGIRQ